MLLDLASALVGLPVALGHERCCWFVLSWCERWFLLLAVLHSRRDPTVIFFSIACPSSCKWCLTLFSQELDGQGEQSEWVGGAVREKHELTFTCRNKPFYLPRPFYV